MDKPKVPTFDQVSVDLADFFPVAYAGMESALASTKEYFDSLKVPTTDPFLAPCLVRYHAKGYFKSRAVGLVKIDDIANNGLSLYCGGYHIRILKSDEGELPGPGDSRLREAFFNQIPLDLDDDRPEGRQVNLVMLWEDGANYQLSGLSIACPKTSEINKASVEVHWHQPIPHPATVAKAQPAPENQEDADDLGEMKLNKDEDTGSTDG